MEKIGYFIPFGEGSLKNAFPYFLCWSCFLRKDMKFEEALAKLSEINEKLSAEDVSLEDSVKLFKEGVELTKFCQKKLDEAKQEIEQIEI